MKADELQRFAEDLRFAALRATVELSTRPDGLHKLRINGAEFFFRADGSGYDGWGRWFIDPTEHPVPRKEQ